MSEDNLGAYGKAINAISEMGDEIDRLRAENEKLRAALQPFSGMVQYCESMSDSESHCVLVGDLRAAATALKGTGDE